MKNLIMASMLVVASGSTIASDWVKIGDTDSLIMYVDKTSIHKKGTYWQAWIKIEYGEAHKNYDDSSFNKTVSLYAFDCNERAVAAIQINQFFDEKIVYAGLTSSTLDFSVVLPDSIGEAKLDYVCQKGQSKPKSKSAISVPGK